MKLCSVPALPINGQVPRRSRVSPEGNRDNSVSGKGEATLFRPLKTRGFMGKSSAFRTSRHTGNGRDFSQAKPARLDWGGANRQSEIKNRKGEGDLILQLTRTRILLMKEGEADPVYKISETSKT